MPGRGSGSARRARAQGPGPRGQAKRRPTSAHAWQSRPSARRCLQPAALPALEHACESRPRLLHRRQAEHADAARLYPARRRCAARHPSGDVARGRGRGRGGGHGRGCGCARGAASQQRQRLRRRQRPPARESAVQRATRPQPTPAPLAHRAPSTVCAGEGRNAGGHNQFATPLQRRGNGVHRAQTFVLRAARPPAAAAAKPHPRPLTVEEFF